MKILTNNEKIKVIKLAIKNLKERECICDAIYHVYNEIYNENSNYTITFKLIPEILKYEPKRKYIDKDGWQTGYWWSPYNTKIRIKTLEKVIEDLSK